MSISSAYSVHKRTDDIFFVAMALLVFGTVFYGFARTYFLAGLFRAQLPSAIVHIHGAVFSLWVLLFVTQVALVSANRVSWHKRLGVLGMFLAPLLVLLGLAVLVDAIRRRAAFGLGIDALTAGDTLVLSVFSILVTWAFLARRNPPEHKRLMILSMVPLLGPALARWPLPFLFSPIVLFYILWDFAIICLIVFDLITLKKIHRATIAGALLMVAMQFLIMPIGHSAWWHHLVMWVQNA
jgi:hypothetical protein